MGMLEGIADVYTAELDAYHNSLRLFVDHAGEMGRAHETFFRSVLRRLIPEQFQIGTGFVLTNLGVSRQQDILVHDRDHFIPFFEVGDCSIIDSDALAAAIEVKTSLDGAELSKALDSLSDLSMKLAGRNAMIGIYAWNGIELQTTLDHLRDFVTKSGQP